MHPATLEDDALLAQCELNKQRTTGPGGQHRNKVETAVRLLHSPTGITAQAGERRSAVDNKRMALRRLRLALAVEIRAPVPSGDAASPLWRSRIVAGPKQPPTQQDPVLRSLGVHLRSEEGAHPQGRIACNPEHHDYPALLAEALDFIAAASWDHKPAALRLGVSPSQLVKLIRDHPPAMLRLNAERAAHSLAALK